MSLRDAKGLLAVTAPLSFHAVLAKVVITIITFFFTEVVIITIFIIFVMINHEGDCDRKEDCQGNLVCGKDNCEVGEWFDDTDDCCADIGKILVRYWQDIGKILARYW